MSITGTVAVPATDIRSDVPEIDTTFASVKPVPIDVPFQTPVVTVPSVTIDVWPT
jgi:hypothetical protein